MQSKILNENSIETKTPATPIKEAVEIKDAVEIDTPNKRLKTSPKEKEQNFLMQLGPYKVLEKVGEGTFGHVFKAIQEPSQKMVALKRLIFPFEQSQSQSKEEQERLENEGVPMITYRETRLLRLLKHENIIDLMDVYFERENIKQRSKIYYVFPLMKHDLAGVIDNQQIGLSQPMVKCLIKQILEGLRFMHYNNVMHRDLKPANVLISEEGIVKLTDFGLARPVDRAKIGNYTPNVITRWYRAPEVCLGTSDYSTKIDIWSVGCIFGELLLRKPILKGHSDMDQIFKIFELCGTPTNESWPDWHKHPHASFVQPKLIHQEGNMRFVFKDYPDAAGYLLKMFLELNPVKRYSAELALLSEYFWSDPLPLEPHELPIFESSLEYNTTLAKEIRERLQQKQK